MTQPNLLVIVLDDIGLERLPEFPALSAVSRVFERFYTMPSCAPTRSALWTGQYPWRNGIGAMPVPGEALALDAVTLPEALPSDYYTACLGKWHLAATDTELQPIAQGLTCYQGSLDNPTTYQDVPEVFMVPWWQQPCTLPGYGPEAQTTAALQFLGAPWSQPWFLCLNYYAAHGILGPSGESVFPVPPGMYQTGDPTLDQQAIIDYLEAQLEERLLPTVNLQETYLFVFSDNGTPSDAGGVEGRAKGSVYEEGVRNRLWVAGPGITPGVDTTSMVSVTDLWATCMDLTGGCGSGVGGEDSWSLAATLGGAPRQGPLWAGRFNPNVPPHDVYVQAAIEARWKLHRNKSGGEKFFDLEADPGELVELPLQGPDYGRLKAFLDSAHL